MGLMPDDAIGLLPRDKRGIATPTHRGYTNYGLRRRVLGRWTFQVTGGNDGTDTFNFTVGGSSICGGTVAWTTNHNTTAAAIATAINAQSNNYIATVSADTVTIRQRKTAGAVTITKVVVNDAAGTLTAVTASTDTYTEHVSGATFDGDEYYELSWSGALCTEVDLTNATLVDLDLYCDGQAFQLWFGGLRQANNVIIQGVPTASVTWEKNIPWLDASYSIVIKLAADEELIYRGRYF